MVPARSSTAAAAFFLLVATSPVAAANPVGTEFQVNSYTPHKQRNAAVAMDANGDFVVVWESDLQDGSEFGVFGQRFASSGARLGNEFRANSTAYGLQRNPALAMHASGDFVVVWESDNQDGYNLGVFGRRFSSAGVPLASEFQVNLYTPGSQSNPAVAIDDVGGFIVVWDSENDQDGYGEGIFGRRFASTGAAVGGEFQVNSYTPSGQRYATVAIDDQGDFVVAWESTGGQDGYGIGIAAQRFSSAGAAVGDEFMVNTTTSSHQTDPVIGLDATGAFVVAWEAQNEQDGDGRGVIAQRFSSEGNRLGGEVVVNTYTINSQAQPSLAMDDAGGFLVAWSSNEQDGNGYGVFVRRFSSAGARVAAEFQANTYTTDVQDLPSVALNDAGDFVIAWRSADQDGGVDGVFAQLYVEGGRGLDVDGDGETEALTDGLLVLRRLFGFTGTTLIAGAVDLAHCTRCDATTIEAHLASIALLLDVDDDGENEALTDGLLVLRWLFGFTGATLINGAVDTLNCTRCSAGDIESYIQGLAA